MKKNVISTIFENQTSGSYFLNDSEGILLLRFFIHLNVALQNFFFQPEVI